MLLYKMANQSAYQRKQNKTKQNKSTPATLYNLILSIKDTTLSSKDECFKMTPKVLMRKFSLRTFMDLKTV